METSEGEENNLIKFCNWLSIIIDDSLYPWNLMDINTIHRGRGMLSDSCMTLVIDHTYCHTH